MGAERPLSIILYSVFVFAFLTSLNGTHCFGQEENSTPKKHVLWYHDDNRVMSLSPPKEGTSQYKSESKAFVFSFLGTFVPVAAGGLVAAFSGPDLGVVTLDSITSADIIIALISTGVLFGPAYGYFYAGLGRRGMIGITIRVLTAGSIIALLATEPDLESGALVLVPIGGLVAIISAIYDIAKVSDAVRKHNRSLMQRESLIVSPKYFSNHKAVGVELRLFF